MNKKSTSVKFTDGVFILVLLATIATVNAHHVKYKRITDILFSTREPDLYYYPNGTWKMPYKGDDTGFSPGGVPDLDPRTYYFAAICQISPAMWVKMMGAGSQRDKAHG